eukprot:CAMPEP_0201869820 /NCGR_PEP_ID=MMETSP0902-20130614/3192_1 /ASSEMBLY_ACC=CAM_ASM_000551 /TAXON_ID=420261 /ORGANISM="Thalassiosira antarctica, Strain CCMP982" /LENGTH=215 /DNA_ID=CAMNT_0048395375 /DNA_START=9 /DNA_END=656 /DNA_ORIENTATION=+
MMTMSRRTATVTVAAALHRRVAFVILLVAIASNLPSVQSFALSQISMTTNRSVRSLHSKNVKSKYSTKLYAEEGDDVNNATTEDFSNQFNEPELLKPPLGDSESTLLGIAGLLAANIMIYSESVLFETGCGLPAGPGGLVGAAEGLSYLGVVGFVGFSLYTRNRTGYGLAWNKVLGGAELLSYVALLAGLGVLVAQVVNYGYIPNAVPMDGGMCQ